MSLATRKNQDSFPIFWKKNIDHPQIEGRKIMTTLWHHTIFIVDTVSMTPPMLSSFLYKLNDFNQIQ